MRDIERFLTVIQVAHIIGRTPTWFYKYRAKLEQEQGFPKPVLGRLYDPLALRAWRLAQLEPHLRAVLIAARETAAAPAAVDLETDWDAVLRANAERVAGALDRVA